jgi:hypothetical protein
MATGSTTRRLAWAVVVVAAHAVLVLLLLHATRARHVPPPPPARAGLLWLVREADVLPIPPDLAPRMQRPQSLPQRQPRSPSTPPAGEVQPQAITLAPAPSVADTALVVPDRAPAASTAKAGSSPPSQTRLLDTAATRDAIRRLARDRPLNQRADAAAGVDDRPGAEQRLGREIERAGIGDCAKGEFAFAGGGLLSLPALVYAELAGKCKR